MKQPYWLIRGSLIAAIGIGFFHAETVAQSTHGLFLPTLSRSYAPVTQPPLVPLGTEEWTQEAHDAQRTGYSPINPATPWTLLYTFNASDSQGGSTCPNNDPTKGHCYNAAREAHTVTGGGALFVPAGQRGLYALNVRTGAVRWQFTDATFNSTPAFLNGYVYAGSAEGRLYRINLTSGDATYYDAGSPLNRGILIVNDAVYALAENGQLHKVNASSMSRVWVYNAGSSTTEGTGISYSASRDIVLFGSNDLYVHAVNNSDGSRKWRVKPSPNTAGFPNQFLYYWPVVAEKNGVVFIRMRLDHNVGLWGFPTVTSNSAARSFLNSNPDKQSLFALNLDDGSKKFIPAVGYGGTEDMVTGNGCTNESSCSYLVTGPPPVVKTWADGSEVAYIQFRNNQGNTSDARWDSHLGEMVLNNSTINGYQAGDLRFVRMGGDNKSYITVTDEQNPLTMAGNAIFHAHWGASEGIMIQDRSSSRGGSFDNPITSTALPPVIRRMQACTGFNATTHATNCGMTLYGETRYWSSPGFWTYWNTWDPPTTSKAAGAYSDGLLPRYTYVSADLLIVEGNGGDLMIFRHSGP